MNEKIIAAILVVVAIVSLVFLYQQAPKYLGGGILNLTPGSGADIKPPKIPTGAIFGRPMVNIKIKNGSGVVGVGYGTPRQIPAPAPVSKPVKIISINSGSYGVPVYSTVSLAVEGLVDLTGWKIKSKSDSFTIPQAYQYYTGLGSSLTDLKAKKGDRVFIYSNTGAIIPGFEINKCMGYLTKTNNFVPSIYASCPQESISNIADYSSQCQNYINSLWSCSIIPANPPIRPDDSQCFDYLRKLNYPSCLELHRTDADFYSGEWRLWLGDSFGNSKLIFDSSHDKVGLYNPAGALVDEYVY